MVLPLDITRAAKLFHIGPYERASGSHSNRISVHCGNGLHPELNLVQIYAFL